MNCFLKQTYLFIFGCLIVSVLSIPLDDTTLREAIIQYMVKGDGSDYGPIDKWDVAQVGNMTKAFADLRYFNGDVSLWDVSNVTIMDKAFFNADSFNRNLNLWNVEKVTSMNFMFGNAKSFKSKLDTWQTSSVGNMSGMFYDATSFNSDISTWNVANVTEMYSMFEDATSFDVDLTDWDVSNVTNFDYMFFYASSFNQALCWDISTQNSMKRMFVGTTSNLVPYFECGIIPQSPLRIISALSDADNPQYCMYPDNNHVAAGNKIAIHNCKLWKSFKWTIDTEGKIHNVLKPNLCVHMKGKRMLLEDCIDGERNQRFIYDDMADSLTNVKNGMKRVAVSSGTPSDKLPVKHLDVAGGADAEKWKIVYDMFPPTPEIDYAAYRIVTRLSTEGGAWCLVPSQHFIGVGAKLTIAPCKGWDVYQWQMNSQGQIMNYANSNLCISSFWRRVELQTCKAGKAQQRWMYSKLGKSISVMRNGLMQMTVDGYKKETGALVKLMLNKGPGYSYQTWDIQGTGAVVV